MAIEPISFDFLQVRGISRNQLEQHYKLYLGYIRSLEDILLILKNQEQSNYEYRGLKNGESYSLDGIKLHELYFENLGESSTRPSWALRRAMDEEFGSYEKWVDDFLRCARVARGWVVLAYDFRDRRIHNIMQDAHNEGAIWQAEPLLVLDVYEHAYMIDFGIDREEYLEVFTENIRWDVVNRRVRSLYR